MADQVPGLDLAGKVDPVGNPIFLRQKGTERPLGSSAVNHGKGDLFRKVDEGLKQVEQSFFPVFRVSHEDEVVGLFRPSRNRSEFLAVQAVIDHTDFFRRNPEGGGDFPRRIMRDGDDPIHPPADPSLHEEGIIEDPLDFLLKGRRVFEPGGPIDGEGVVDRGHHGDTQGLPKDLAVPQALVVVENMETVVPHQFPQFEIGAETEGPDLGKDPETGGSKLVKIQGRENFEGISRGQKIGLFPEKIEILNGVND
jgi:hypothetical protein